jgi:RNA polymerase sigma factor (sigma-70 family)
MPTPMNKVTEHLRRAGLLPDGGELTDGQLLECFVSRRETAALEALVHRHGPMVWGVCRRLLHDHHDAEDAFQATFLVLVRKAGSVLPRDRVGNWLYGVAHQTARKARALRARRLARERQVTTMPEAAAEQPETLWAELRPLLDDALSRLPDKYRTAVVLCDLEGKTRKEAARQLAVPEGTLAARLARARALLAKRLARHGLALSAGTLAVVLSQKAAPACVPAPVLTATAKTLTPAAAAPPVVLPGTVAALTEGVLKMMWRKKLLQMTAMLLVLTVIGLGGGLYLLQRAGAQPDRTDKTPKNREEGKGPKPGDGGRDRDADQQAVPEVRGKWLTHFRVKEAARAKVADAALALLASCHYSHTANEGPAPEWDDTFLDAQNKNCYLYVHLPKPQTITTNTDEKVTVSELLLVLGQPNGGLYVRTGDKAQRFGKYEWDAAKRLQELMKDAEPTP